MNRRLVVLLAIMGALIICYGALVRVTPVAKPAKRVASAKKDGVQALASPRDPNAYGDVTVKIEIPPSAEFPEVWARGKGCPHNKLSGVLGAKIGAGGGVLVFAVEPGKPAAKAGIQPGDRLGGPDDCPSSLYRSFAPRKEPRTITWTIRRPKNLPAQPAAGKPLDEPKQPGVAAGSR